MSVASSAEAALYVAKCNELSERALNMRDYIGLKNMTKGLSPCHKKADKRYVPLSAFPQVRCQEKILDSIFLLVYYIACCEVRSLENIVEHTMLYDFYGELLTDHQKQIYEYYLDDYSLSEIAEEAGISRQGVHDLIKRCNKILSDYEEKLGLVSKFEAARVKVDEIHRLANADTSHNSTVKEIEKLSGEILEAF